MIIEYPPDLKEKEYKIKVINKDFIVEELFNYDIQNSGRFIVFKLTKENLNTIDAIKIISSIINIPLKNIGYAGLKDKKAITTQFISLPNAKNISAEYNFSSESFRLKLSKIGFRNEKIFPGCLSNNKFEITIRNLKKYNILKNKNKKELPNHYVNFFGEQRFSKKNHLIGKFIIKKEYEKALNLIKETLYDNQKEDFITKINNCNGDFLKILLSLDKKLLRIYLHAFQSEIWNKSAFEYLKKNNINDINEINNKETNNNLLETYIPLVGFSIEANDEIKEIINKILSSENLSEKDFILRSFQGLGLEGGNRSLINNAIETKIINISDDEFNPNKEKIILSFILSKGSYATEYIRQISSFLI
jgi:tRNA pseudouridine13 synthase